MSTFQLSSLMEDQGLSAAAEQEHLGSALLLHNARWFMKVRWIVVSVFIAAGLAGTFTLGRLKTIGIVPPNLGLFILAATMVVVNAIFYILLRSLKEDSPRNAIERNIWLQILADLLVVTVLVHIIGSTNTFIAFAYLFHIALACIFFPPRGSLFVTLLASGLYLILIAVELTGTWPPTSALTVGFHLAGKDPTLILIFAGSAVFVWLVVWYFISTLSKVVRKRDQQLSAANEQLMMADEEKSQQVLMTTHELKAPFSGIETNIQVLKIQYWDEIPESVHGIIDKIEARARTLRERIGEILILGDLKSYKTSKEEFVPVNLQSVTNDMIGLLSEKAKDRQISLDIQIPPITVMGNKNHLSVLLSNLVSNAIAYSHEGGKVKIAAENGKDQVSVTVTDHGIGIRDDALPHIFDEYYRTKEGVKFNKASTGLGLSMVKEIARKYRIGIKVRSEMGKGTTFEVIIPKKEQTINIGG